MSYCAVVGCTNAIRRKSNCSFFRFPHNEFYRKSWLEVCSPNLKSISYARICSDHFRPEFFKPKHLGTEFVDKLLNKPPREIRRLFPHAIPTEKLSSKKQKSSYASNENGHVCSEEDASTSFESDESLTDIHNLYAEEHLEEANASQNNFDSNDLLNSILSSLPNCNFTSEEERKKCIEKLEKIKDDLIAQSNEELIRDYDTLANEHQKCLNKMKDDEKINAEVKNKLENLTNDHQHLKENFEKLRTNYEGVKEDRKEDCIAFLHKIDKIKESEAHWKRECHIYKIRKEYAENKLNFVSREKEELIEKLQKIYTPGQLEMLLYNKKKPKWGKDDIASAISLRATGAKSYEYLRNVMKMPFPSRSSLRRWMEGFDVEPGILKSVIKIMRKKGEFLNTRDKLTILSFDEIHLSPQYCVDRKKEKIVGPHSACQVVMARGLCNKWKQVVYYDYNQPMTKEILFSIIEQLYENGYYVVGMVSDMYTSNVGLWNQLGVSSTSKGEVFFPHPSDDSIKIHAFADVPHLIKLARNHFLDSTFTFDNLRTDKKYLQYLLEANGDDLKIAFSLTLHHLNCVGTARQKVKLATQLFSNKNAKALKYCLNMINTGNSNFHQFSGCEETSRVLQLFNDWFDLFNVKCKYNNSNGTSGFGLNLNKQNELLNDMTSYITQMRIGKHKSMIPFQKGIHLNNLSLPSLQLHLKEKFQIDYILTHRLNQDLLENFFSFIRAAGRGHDHPTSLEIKYRLRWYILGKHAMIALSDGCNNEQDVIDKSLINASDLEVNDSNFDDIPLSNAMVNDNVIDEDVEVDYSVENLIDPSDFYADKTEENPKPSSHFPESSFHKNADDNTAGTSCQNNVSADHNLTETMSECLYSDKDIIADENILSLSDEFKDTVHGDYENINKNSEYSLEIYTPSAEEDLLLKELENSFIKETIAAEGLKYIAGYVANRFPKDSSLGDKTSQLSLNSSTNTDWVCLLSRGGLKFPSKDFLNAAEVMNQEFEKFHGNTFSEQPKIFQTVALNTQKRLNVDIDIKVLLCLVRTRTYIRLRELNKRLFTDRISRKKQKRMKKFTNI